MISPFLNYHVSTGNTKDFPAFTVQVKTHCCICNKRQSCKCRHEGVPDDIIEFHMRHLNQDSVRLTAGAFSSVLLAVVSIKLDKV